MPPDKIRALRPKGMPPIGAIFNLFTNNIISVLELLAKEICLTASVRIVRISGGSKDGREMAK